MSYDGFADCGAFCWWPLASIFPTGQAPQRGSADKGNGPEKHSWDTHPLLLTHVSAVHMLPASYCTHTKTPLTVSLSP